MTAFEQALERIAHGKPVTVEFTSDAGPVVRPATLKRFRTVCAWCEREAPTPGVGGELVSHGICDRHLEECFGDSGASDHEIAAAQARVRDRLVEALAREADELERARWRAFARGVVRTLAVAGGFVAFAFVARALLGSH